MDSASPRAPIESGLQVYHEAPQHYIPPTTEGAHYAPEKAHEVIPAIDEIHRDRIAGLRPKAFWIVIALAGLIIIGASVGGAVGGTRASQKETPTVAASAVAKASSTGISTAQTSATSTSSSASAVRPTSIPSDQLASGYNITTDCPSSGGSTYNGPAPFGGRGAYTFSKTCFANTGGIDLISAFTPDFNTCIDLCSNWNYKIFEVGLSEVRCTSAVFLVDGAPPNNCWAKNGTDIREDRTTGLALIVSGTA